MVKLIFNRDEDLLVDYHPYGLPEMSFDKGDEIFIKSYSTNKFGTDMWDVVMNDGTEFCVMKESVEIEKLPLTQ